MTAITPVPGGYAGVHADIVSLLEAARQAAARSVNALMTATYWEIGRRIVEFEQGGQERAAYGEALIERLSADLSTRFGRGFSRQNLWQMRLFYPAWSTAWVPSPSSAPARPDLTGARRIGVLLSHGFTGQPASIRPWGEALAEHHDGHPAPAGAEGHADADLVRALADEVRDDAVDTHRGERESR